MSTEQTYFDLKYTFFEQWDIIDEILANFQSLDYIKERTGYTLEEQYKRLESRYPIIGNHRKFRNFLNDANRDRQPCHRISTRTAIEFLLDRAKQ